MIRYEILKLIRHHALIGIIIVLSLFCVFGFKNELIDDNGYRALSTQIRNSTKKSELCEQLQDRYEKTLLDEWNEAYITGNRIADLRLLADVIGELNQTVTYDDNIRRRLQLDEYKLRSYLYRSSALYSSLVAEQVNEELLSVHVEYQGQYAYRIFVTSKSRMIFGMLLPVLLAMYMLFSERDTNMSEVLYCSKYSQNQLFLAKILAGGLWLFLNALVVSVIELGYLVWRFGAGNWNAPFQTIQGMLSYSKNLSVAMVVLANIGVQIVGMISMFLLGYCLGTWIQNRVLAVALYGIGQGLSAFAFYRIPVYSNVALFRWLNLFSMIEARQLIIANRIPGLHTKMTTGGVTVLVFLLVDLLCIGLCCYKNSRHPGSGSVRHSLRRLGWSSLRGIEMRKWFLHQKGWILLAGLFAICIWGYPTTHRSFTGKTELFYQKYIEESRGSYTNEKKEKLLTEQDKIETIQKTLIEDELPSAVRAYYEEYVERMGGLELAIEQVTELSRWKDAAILHEQDYEFLFGQSDAKDSFDMNCLFLVLVSIGISCMIWGYDAECSVNEILIHSAKREAKRRRRNEIQCVISVLLCGLIVFGIWFARHVQNCRFDELTASCRSLHLLRGVPGEITILGALILYYVGILLFIMLLGCVTGYFYSRFRKGKH